MIVIESRHFEDFIRVCAGLAREGVAFTARFHAGAAVWTIQLTREIKGTV